MKLLITGRGTSGSWQIRGVQLGAAIEATVMANASQAVIDHHDLVVVVKRASEELLDRLKKKPVVLDVVDGWPQPEGNWWGPAESLRWLDLQRQRFNPIAVVAATDRMAADCSGQVLSLRHHARPGLAMNPIRERVQKVGYEGGIAHLGKWQLFLQAECEKRGWEFVLNPKELADLDIVVALREANGYPARYWKSGVKVANAQGSGTPCVMNREAGYVEIAKSGFADTEAEVRERFDALEPQSARAAMSEELREGITTIQVVASRYKTWLDQLSF